MAIDRENSRERDLFLAHNQYILVQDQTKGHVNVYVGPHKTSLGATDIPVVFNEGAGTFDETPQLNSATRQWPFAKEGSYIVLDNPATDTTNDHPPMGNNSLVKLKYGRKINIPGPATFPLWPGQVARVLEGHRLRSNQYLVVRVYNEEEAKKNWKQQISKPAAPIAVAKTGEQNTDSNKPDELKEGEQQSVSSMNNVPSVEMPELTMGTQLVIKGTEVSFYIPPTGIEVVPDDNKRYVRDAVTLERLEYCILLSEDGTKRYMVGPDVVFPEPVETFIEKEEEAGTKTRKFRARELNNDMGIYVKIIEDYTDEDGEHKSGEELFITGRERKIYFPRQEHAIVKYGNQMTHHGVAIPAGEARYVLDKNTGKVDLVRGPRIFLPDPRNQVIVRRILSPKLVELLYPGNQEALNYNKILSRLTDSSRSYVPEDVLPQSVTYRASNKQLLGSDDAGLVGEDFSRKEGFTSPRTITLNTKFDGAPGISVWNGYAVLIINKSGEGRVAVGPASAILAYDETVQVLSLSTGKPKNTDKLQETAYLRVKNNQVSDIVRVVTKDMVEVDIKLSYRVNFEGIPSKWFAVENYVKFLCDHGRSLLRNAVKRVTIDNINDNQVDIIRDAILGKSVESKGRSGLSFEENGMRVYDVEVLGTNINNDEIEDLLNKVQLASVRQSLDVVGRTRELETVKTVEDLIRKIQVEKDLTETARITSESELSEKRQKAGKDKAIRDNEIAELQLAAERKSDEQEIALEGLRVEGQLKELDAQVKAVERKAKALTPQLISALQQFADKHLAAEAVKSMSPMAILGGKSVAEVFNNMLHGTVFEGLLNGKAISAGHEDNGETRIPSRAELPRG